MSAAQDARDALVQDAVAQEAVASDAVASPAELEESPENLPPMAWGSLILFALFVVGFGSCAGFFLFR